MRVEEERMSDWLGLKGKVVVITDAGPSPTE